MAFVELDFAKTDVARRVEQGRGAIAFPATGLTETSIRPLACGDCHFKTDHDVCVAIGVKVPFGEGRYQRISNGVRATVDDVNRLQSGLFLAGYGFIGYPSPRLIYNVSDTANNATQSITYEIVEAPANRSLRLYGPNPKRLAVGFSRENPFWPFPAPSSFRPDGITDEQWDTMKYGRLIPGSLPIALPIAAQVDFAAPSALAGKVLPIITRIDFPEEEDEDPETGNAEFTVWVSCVCNAADTPFDLAFPPVDDKYFCTIRFEFVAQQAWLNVQDTVDSHWARQERTITEAPVDDLLYLTNSNNANTRVLMPWMLGGVFGVTQVATNASEREWSLSEINERLTVDDPSTDSWVTTLDLSDVDWLETNEIRLVYFAEAISTDVNTLLFQGGCSHAQAEPTESHLMFPDSLHRCAAPDATQFGEFAGRKCWKPTSCSHFYIGTETAPMGGITQFAASHQGQGAFWSSLWSRADWYIEQSIPGLSSARSIFLRRPSNAGPSIQGLGGGFRDDLPEGYYPFRRALVPPPMGKRLTWTDDGDQFQAIVPGTWFTRSYDFTGLGGPSYFYQRGVSLEQGWLAQAITGWTTQLDARGDGIGLPVSLFPYRNTGGTGIYSFTHSGSGLSLSNQLQTLDEANVVGVFLDGAEDALVTTGVRARFGEI